MANLSIPARNFAIAHLEHWHDGWPDYSDGLIGTLSLKIGGLLEKFVSYDEVEVLIFVGFLVAIVVAISLNTIGNKSGVRLIYVGIGLTVAGGFSNQVEALVFGHVTDFLFFWVPVIGPSSAIANLADIMIVGGLIIIFVVAPFWRRLSLEMALIEREENETRSQSG